MMDDDQNEDLQGDKGEGGDSPLIDLNDAQIKKLMAENTRSGGPLACTGSQARWRM